MKYTKKIINESCVILSILLVIVGINIAVDDYGIHEPMIGPFMFLLGGLGLLLQVYLYNMKK